MIVDITLTDPDEILVTTDGDEIVTVDLSAGDTIAVGAVDGQGMQGEKGDTGSKGDKGDTGATGATGEKGETGARGEKGDTGAGVPSGGSADQVLTKIDGTNYNTEWRDAQNNDQIFAVAMAVALG